MIASERRVLAEGETRLSLTKKLALSGRPVKIYVIDPKKFQERLNKYVGVEDFKDKDGEGRQEGQKSQSKSQQTEGPAPPKATNNKNTAKAPKKTTTKKKPGPIAIAPREQPKQVAPPEQQQQQQTHTTTMTTMILAPNALLPFSMIPMPLTSLPIVGSLTTTTTHVQTSTTPTVTTPQEVVGVPEVKKKKKKAVKRKLTLGAETSKRKSLSEDKAESAEMAFLMKESTTRTGRVSKSATATAAAAANATPIAGPSSAAAGVQNGENLKKIRKRDPPEKFRCQTCQKFYLGNAKFNQHFEKFPDHVKPDPNVKTVRKPKQKKPQQQDVVLVGAEETPNNFLNLPRNEEVEEEVAVTAPPPRSPVIAPSNSDDDSLGITAFTRIMRSKVNPDILSDNCSSPKLPAFSVEEPLPLFNMSEGRNQTTSRDEDQPEYFLDFNNSISCSQQSFNSLENLLADNNSHITRIDSDNNIPSSISTSPNTSTFFSSARSGSLINSSVNTSSYVSSVCSSSSSNIPMVVAVGPICEESRDINDNEEVQKGVGQGAATGENGVGPKRKSIWEFVKEQIRLCGINQTCGEISEMAEKLSKIARDKFYPIQEEEIERLGNASPVIQVDTPFISHLLDLPFGTYMFKEDGGIRKIIPPPTPVSTELSLTNGVEVDVDKFLPDMDLISLPHLTNLDFNSI